MRRNTPPDFKPSYEAYEAQYREEAKPLACCLIGVQDRGGDAAPARADARALLRLPEGPAIVEYGWHEETSGARTHLLMAYWRDAERYRRWRSGAAPNSWLEAALDSPQTGRYIESVVVPPRGLDTLIADPAVHWGLAKLADEVTVTPYHGYWGGTRDRIRQSDSDALGNPAGAQLPLPTPDLNGIGEIVDVELPEHAVAVRGGPDWSKSPPDELREFRNWVYPAYVRGGRYLAANPEAAGCYAACLIQETDSEDRDVPRNHLIAFFTQLSRLEEWTRSHPTHLEIFGRYLAMIRKLDNRLPAINLYHEVTVAPRGGLTAAYSNCLPQTGLLRFGQVRARSPRSEPMP